MPCGAAAQNVETATGIDLEPGQRGARRSPTCSARSPPGEADAGLVYVTDVKGAGDKVDGVPFPESTEAVNTYPIAAADGQQARRTWPNAFVAAA